MDHIEKIDEVDRLKWMGWWAFGVPWTMISARLSWSNIFSIKQKLSHEENLLTFRYTGCLIGILKLFYYNMDSMMPYIP